MAGSAQVTGQFEQDGYVVMPDRLGEDARAAARREIGGLLTAAGWGS